jgi:hypothetical protein
VHAQKNYAVKVADSKTEDPVANASVVIKSTKIKAITGETGLLVIQAEPGEVLVITCPGYTSQEATLSVSAAVQVFLVKKKSEKRKKMQQNV